jgi:hypothetical protein
MTPIKSSSKKQQRQSSSSGLASLRLCLPEGCGRHERCSRFGLDGADNDRLGGTNGAMERAPRLLVFVVSSVLPDEI